MTYVVIATWVAKEELEEEVVTTLLRLQAASLQEAGCRAYRIHRNVENPRVFLLYEQYDDEESYQRHLESDHFRELAVGYGIPRLEMRERTFYSVVG